METKADLRRHYKALREALDPSLREAWSRRVCERIRDFCVSRRIRRVGAFWPLGSELDLRPLIQGQPDWTFLFPKVASTSPPRLVWGPEPLEQGPWGLMEPVLAQHFTPPVHLLLVPGLVFDDRGYRIGYGKGFYDALLEHLPEEVVTLGVGFKAQRRTAIPESPQDLPVQGMVTEEGIEWFDREGA